MLPILDIASEQKQDVQEFITATLSSKINEEV